VIVLFALWIGGRHDGVVGDDGTVAPAVPGSAKSGPETRVAGLEKSKSVVSVSPKASDVIDERLFEARSDVP
jgi:hypothetical protein